MRNILFALALSGSAFGLQDPGFAAGPLAWKYQYDELDRLIRKTDPAGRSTDFQYSGGEKGSPLRLTKTPPEGSPVDWQLDDRGRLVKMTDEFGSVDYGYDEWGRLERVQRKGGPAIVYAYDTLDRITRVKIGDFYELGYTYDFLGRVSSLDTPAGRIRYDYQTGQNTVIRTLSNGVKTFWKRQPNGQLEEIIHGHFKKPDDKSYSVLAEYKYTHGPEGRIEAISERSVQGEFTRRYAYDKMGRLTDATGPSGQAYHYEYDPVGNRTKATTTGQPEQVCNYDWAGRLSTVNGKSCKYDACGNLTELNLGNETRQYSYRPDGRLVEAQAGGESVQYRYDGFGRLVARKTTAGETRFIPDPLSPYWQPLVMEEPDGARTLVVWDGNTPLALVRRDKVEWMLHDHLGSVRLVTDEKGKVSRDLDYDSFGRTSIGQGKIHLAPGFAGLFWDAEAGVYHTLARAYRPDSGLFLQPDPLLAIGWDRLSSEGLYTYGRGNPVCFLDRKGEASEYFMTNEMLKSNRKLFAKLLLEVGNVSLNGRPGELWDLSGLIFRGLESAHSATSTMRTVLDYPGDPANDFRMGGLLLKTYGLLGQGYFLASAAGAAATQVSFAEMIGSGIRSRVLQNRMERQASFGGSVLPGDLKIQEDLGRYHGSFSIAGEGVSAHGAWALTGSNVGLFGRNRHFVGYVKSEVENRFTPRGERISGTFGRAEIREERGGSLFNLHEPTSVTVKRYSHDRYQISSKGGGIMSEADAFPTPKFTSLQPKRSRAEEPIDSASSQNASWGSSQPPPPPPPPSPVGGVYLGGAGGAMDGLGMLKGVRTDANGNLVLIGEGDVDVKLPPLRLDDVVTVFRSVYLHGEGPTVTIDPNPENPEKSAMIIRHGKATEDTYVGWILYQADRLMKSYCQGVDNKTEKDVISRVSGYSNILDTIYFGGADPRKAQKEGVWERFWIVPAEARRFEGPHRELTLFDVPLKVKTQKMKWEKGKLVDDAKGKSSPGATAFTAWFTTNYDGIGAEQYLTPPPESGITGPVPVFTELRQIALMTAVAEKLRDQGVAMPFWMRDYEVRKVSFERFTPGMEVTRKRQQGNAVQTARIFGGVELSPDSKAVKTYNTVADAAKAPAEIRAEVDRGVKLADRLERAVASVISPVAQEPLTVRQVREGERSYQAASVPGAETLALGPCRLEEVDLAVPVEGGREMRLVRSFNSFFDPKGPWGHGWALDLPRLEEIRIPISRDGSRTAYSTGFELLSPLNSIYARFCKVQPVAELGGAKILVPDAGGPFHGLSEAQPDFLKQVTTRVLLLKDGREWHFTKHGDLVATKEGPQVTVYERGPHGRLTRMVALVGGQAAGAITLEYSPDNRLKLAVGESLNNGKSRSLSIAYAYDDTGRLVGVTSEDGMVGYRYDAARVSAVTWQDKAGTKDAVVLRSFQYDPRGRLLSEKNGDDAIIHSISAEAGGVVAASQVKQKVGSGNGTATTTMRYDLRMRPTEAVADDGAGTHWAYPDAGGVEMTVTTPDKKSVKIVESPDGRKRTIQQDGVPPITAGFDSGGRLTKFSEGDRLVLTQEWRPDGQLFRAESAVQGASLDYGKDGLLSAITLHPAKAGEKLSEWQNTKLDRKGRPIEVTDYSGMEVRLGYDESGFLTSAVQKTPDGNLGYNVKRDDQGRVQVVKSSWGETAYTYEKDGSLKRVVGTYGGKSAFAELASGRVQSFTGFDGGRTTFAYKENGPAEGRPQTITCPNNLVLQYGYVDSGDLATVRVGQDRLVRLGYDAQGRVTSYAWEPVNP